MVTINNVFNNENMTCIASAGPFFVYEHQNDLSVTPTGAPNAYFMKEMNVRKRQVLAQLNGNAIKVQAGAMQWMTGNVEMNANVGGVGGFFSKAVKGAVTGESAVKPIYQGQGFVMLEPTYKFILLEDVGQWGPQGMVLDDGLFFACDASLQENVVRRQNVSSALLGGEGLFNLCLTGNGMAVLESPVPRQELFEFVLQDDVVKIDGNMAIAWSGSLQFTVEKSTKSILGSGLSGEGLLNVYRGTGRILMAPTMQGTLNVSTNGPEQTSANAGGNATAASTIASSIFGN